MLSSTAVAMRMYVLLSMLIASFILASALQAQQGPAGQSVPALLKASKWQKRVLLLCAPALDDANLRRQQQLLEPVRAGLDSRDLVVREVNLSQLSTADKQYLTQRLGVAAGGFMAVLIGKDGGVKRRETRPLPPAKLFSTIDAMPMRQQEMRGKQ
ncbi:DUF4174 domain-containing protein [Microvirga sp. STR05]|uniref:DUF4174 domain-containing protein n=1 Tax=Hymenobacter duratus TaxID=2771356 RepID=A0ABR8JG63_9BACT|nr:DUF4174 domain-containing protein [Hymenobacter duratus]MBD2714731.1 DUF4174 domain-containing protein [Hymenobacter duratus]MBR7949636.1 DUF4174 domain-containing protein [Microvirga sp. STR05]